MQTIIATLLLAGLSTAEASFEEPVHQEAAKPSISTAASFTSPIHDAVGDATRNATQQNDSAGRIVSSAPTERKLQAVAEPPAGIQDATLLVEGLPLWVSPEAVSAWLSSKAGVVATRLNPPDDKGLSSMQVTVGDPAQAPRIAGVRGQLWPIFLYSKLQGLRVQFMPETDTGAIFCTLDGRSAAQQLNAYLTDRFGAEKTGGYYERGGLRARLIYRLYDRRTSISAACDASGQGPGYAHIELYLIAAGDNGYIGGPTETIEVSRAPFGAVAAALSASPQ